MNEIGIDRGRRKIISKWYYFILNCMCLTAYFNEETKETN